MVEKEKSEEVKPEDDGNEEVKIKICFCEKKIPKISVYLGKWFKKLISYRDW